MQLIILIITVLLFISYASLLFYYRYAWKKIPHFSHPTPNTQHQTHNTQHTTHNTNHQTPNTKQTFNTQHTTHISIIIPARNEATNIHACLKSITNQSYPAHLFEVLVIDDHSTDNTAAIVHSFSEKNIKLITLEKYLAAEKINSYKKKAIETGVRQSTGTLIVTTDADCYAPPQWLETIASFYETYNPAFIAAPVAVNCDLDFIEIFQALDFMTLQGITGAAVYKKIHSMCNGANLAYEKKAFYDVNGFEGIDSIASGDDMLLMHKIYKRYPDRIMFLKSRNAIIQTKPQRTIKDFFNQRIRWASKADKYDDKRILPVLAIVYLFNLMLLLFPVIAIFNAQHFTLNIHHFSLFVWVALLILKIIIELFFLSPVAAFFGKQSLLWLFPIMQPFHIIYTIIAGGLGKFGSYQWKGRKVR